MVRLGWSPQSAPWNVDYKRHGGVTTVPLYSAQDVALLTVTRRTVDWHALRTLTAGRRGRSPGLRVSRSTVVLAVVVSGGVRGLLVQVDRQLQKVRDLVAALGRVAELSPGGDLVVVPTAVVYPGEVSGGLQVDRSG
ncbi:hypothetical protein ACFU8I_28645 [Streptomyces sp. NPDC057540]|uniref:hypothetical protein n=1 Tax=Streptomyces sp. NPDC057540 TaxID=3346160 RepID=UPI0036C26776